MPKLSYKDQNLKEFISEAIFDMTKRGVSVKLINKNYVDECSGYFDYENKVFVCATKKRLDKWFIVFVHEYAHFLQYKDKFMEDCDDAYNLFDSWLHGGKDFSPMEVREAAKVIQTVELDADKRAVEIMRERRLNVDIEDYIQKSNVYAYYYTIAPYMRKWIDVRIYDNQEVIKRVPKEFLKNYYHTSLLLKKIYMKIHLKDGK
jgi:hypothetical protein